MKRCIAGVMLAGWAAVPLEVGAQAPPPNPARFTLAEAIARATAASAGLAQLGAVERAARADERGARAARLPQLELSAAYTRQSDVPELILAVPGVPPRPIFPNIPDNVRTRVGVTLPLFTGGRLSGLAAAAREESAASAHDFAAGRADLVLETTAAYWSLVTARESLRVLAEGVTAYEAHLKDARNRAGAGLAARNEVLAVQVERNRAELARLRAESAAAVAEVNLARLLVLPPAAAVEPTEPLKPPPASAEKLDRLVAAALSTRPERAALRARAEAAAARVRSERAAHAPQAAVSAGYDYANPNRRLLPPAAEWKGSWDASISLSLTLFDGGKASAAAARAAARAEAVRLQIEDLDRRIRLQVTQRALEQRSADAAIAVAESGWEAAQENRRVAADRYREGVIPSSELLDAELALLQAGLDRAEALAQARLARAQLDRAVGR